MVAAYCSEAQRFHLLSDFIGLLLGPECLSLCLPLLALLALSFLLSTPECCTIDSLPWVMSLAGSHAKMVQQMPLPKVVQQTQHAM